LIGSADLIRLECATIVPVPSGNQRQNADPAADESGLDSFSWCGLLPVGVGGAKRPVALKVRCSTN
jgi:hypothetical protein